MSMNETRYLVLINRKISAESMLSRASWMRSAGQVWPAGQGMRDADLTHSSVSRPDCRERRCRDQIWARKGRSMQDIVYLWLLHHCVPMNEKVGPCRILYIFDEVLHQCVPVHEKVGPCRILHISLITAPLCSGAWKGRSMQNITSISLITAPLCPGAWKENPNVH